MEKIVKRENFVLKIVALLLGILGIMLFGCAYLLAAPAHGTESKIDMWSPLAQAIENDYQGEGTVNNIANGYYYYSLGSRPLDEIKSAISTPQEAINFRDFNFVYVQDMDQYSQMEYVTSLTEFYNHGFQGDCEDFAIAIAGLLEDDGYTPVTLSLQKKASDEEVIKYGLEGKSGSLVIGHRIFIYQEEGKFGSIGTSSKDDRQPTFDTINELVASFENKDDLGLSYSFVAGDALKNLNDEFSNDAWLNGKGNLKN